MAFIELLITCGLLWSVHCTTCTDMEMVYNGDFSEPQISPSWTFKNSLPGGGKGSWTTNPPQNKFELWKQGYQGSPTQNSKGQNSGQHFEINGDRKWAQLIYEFNVPCLLGSTEATYSFEYWYRRGWKMNNFDVTIEQKDRTFKSSFSNTKDAWNPVSKTFEIQPCQYLKMIFTSDAASTGGVHIDSVSLKVPVCDSVELVSGGDFEDPKIVEPIEHADSLPGDDGTWATTGNKFVLGMQEVWMKTLSGPVFKPVNQWLVVNGLSNNGEVSYIFNVPILLGVAECTLEFDYLMKNPSDSLAYSYKQSGSELIYKDYLIININQRDSWQFYSVSLTLQAAQSTEIVFTAESDVVGGVYIDNVSLKLTELRGDQGI